MQIDTELLSLASPQELALYEKHLERELALASPLDYGCHVTASFRRYPHITLLNDLIVRLVCGRLTHPKTGRIVRRLAVSLPPRHGKSFLISDHTPAWAVTRWADYGFRVGVVGYEAEFAASWGRKARDHVTEYADEFGVKVDNSSKASDRWDLLPTKPGGPRAGMNTAGVGGPLTGKGFHLLIIDDPIKNSEEAYSQTIRDKHGEWMSTTALTRLEPPIQTDDGLSVGSAVILVNTRWHSDDLMGRMTDHNPDGWFHLNLKALADEAAPASDPLGRQPGEALCPARFDVPTLTAIRDDPESGGYTWAALYQGEPNIEGGGIFKRSSFRYHRPAPGEAALTHYELLSPEGDNLYIARSDLARFSTLDLAATTKTSSDWTVLSTFEVTEDRKLLLVDRVRQRLESADHEEFVLHHFERLRPLYVGVEEATYGIGLITSLQRKGVAVRPLKANKDKIGRAITAGSLMDAGRVFLPQAAPWLQEFENELLQFPNGRWDDQVDTLSYAAHEVALGPWSSLVRVRSRAEDRSLEARLHRFIETKTKRRRKGRHPELGRF